MGRSPLLACIPIPLIVLIVAFACPAFAEPAGTADDELARQHFNLAKAYYDQGAYEQALQAFEESYRLSRKGALQYNIARCLEALGRLEPAIEHYNLYLSETATEDSAVVRARIQNLTRRLVGQREQQRFEREKHEKARQAQRAPVAPVATRPTLRRLEVPAPPPLRPALTASTPALPQPAKEGSWWFPEGWAGWTSWSLVGAGTASIVAGVILGAAASAKASQLEHAFRCAVDGTGCPSGQVAYEWSQAQRDFDSPGKAFEAGQIVTLVAGIAAIGAGIGVLLFAPRESAAENTPTVHLWINPASLAGVSGAFRF